jgi:hypothetical protein
MAQTSYAAPALAFPGMLMESRYNMVDSLVNENASPLPFGIGVKKGAAYNGMDQFSAATDFFSGVTVQADQFDPRDLTGTQGIPNAAANLGPAANGVLYRGAIAIRTEVALNPGDPVYVRFASGGGGALMGYFRKDSDSGTARLVRGVFIYKNISATLAWARVDVQLDSVERDYDDLIIPTASVAATTTTHLTKTRTDRFFVVTGVDYVEPATGIAQSDTNYYVLTIQVGGTVIATWSTKLTGGNGAIVANTYVAFALSGTAANLIVNPSSVVDFVETLTGTLTAPAGSLVLHGYYI